LNAIQALSQLSYGPTGARIVPSEDGGVKPDSATIGPLSTRFIDAKQWKEHIMLKKHGRKLIRMTFALTVLAAAIATADSMTPGRAEAQTCDPSVYDFCWGQGRNVDPTICDCNYQSCLGLPESDCREQGGWLNYSTCTCVFPPSY
jgi:hypothetical protein